ncbi:MAG TPA: iron uptake transporter deferrochelatase/peroxidase subunit [Hyphomicrobiales bacterium]|nr:iron uptake transporter deferrochelatase/peroxidase subunit [Hyphomicrobiales bacterium]
MAETPPRDPAKPEAERLRSPGRRNLLLGLGAVGGGAVVGALAGNAAAAEKPGPVADGAKARQPVYGRHQSGVATPRPAAAMIASFDVLATTKDELRDLFRGLTERVAFLMQGGTPPSLDPKFPPADSGVLGPTVTPHDLTVTVAVGASLFDGRFGLAGLKPRHLETMHAFPNDALVADECHGDLLLQICSDSPEANVHALRDVVKHFPSQLMLRWKQDGFAPPQALATPAGTGRNLLGFKDGTVNPDPLDPAAMERVVWVQDGQGEPAWAVGGSYQAVRLIRHFVEAWDRTALQEQENIFGRDKATGAPLGMKREHDEPDFAKDPKGERVPLTAHMRLANPRTKGEPAHRLFRRPFNYSRGITKAAQMDMGLIFICFQADLAAGFITVQNRLNGEPLEEYVKPFGGGYFFVLPGVPDKSRYLGQPLLEA